MAKVEEPFDAVGIVRKLKIAAKNQSEKTTFELEVGKIIVPCFTRLDLQRSPRVGESAHVIGWWRVDEQELVCVEAHAVYPAQYLRD